MNIVAQPATANAALNRDYIPLIALVGCPNVGKSMVFNQLTGAYVAVSNYPGTTVEVTRGHFRVDGQEYEVIDTPGMYTLDPITGEEEVSRRLLLEQEPDIIVHVVDAKNLARMLPLTLALIEAGLSIVLVLNMMDEARRLGLRIDTEILQDSLGVPVVPTVSITGEGIDQLRQLIMLTCQSRGPVREGSSPPSIPYPRAIQSYLVSARRLLRADYQFSRDFVSLLLLQGDDEMLELVKQREPYPQRIQALVCQVSNDIPRAYLQVAAARRERAQQLITEAVQQKSWSKQVNWGSLLDRLTLHPVTGVPILLLVLYFGLYQVVGRFAAGTLVDFLQVAFSQAIEPWINWVADGLMPESSLRLLLAHDYGILTLAPRYALAVVMPIVGSFFLVFSLLEDSGYLPRLAYLMDRVCKHLGLSGRAVIPLVLGLGCDTMATVVTRTLETRRERIIATFLLALAIPCSTQLGIILSILSTSPWALLLWVSFVALVGASAGSLLSRLLPGEEPMLFMELPPLRLPRLSNVAAKLLARMQWYFWEILPLFVLASILIWLGNETGVFAWLLDRLQPIMALLGLPGEMGKVFLFGFFRRDYGAAGLYDMKEGLTVAQLAVSSVTLTLFVPCIAQVTVMFKELGALVASLILVTIFPLAIAFGVIFHHFLSIIGF